MGLPMSRRRFYSKDEIDDFVDNYVGAALFSTPLADDSDAEFLDERYNRGDIDRASMKRVTAECREFAERHAAYFECENIPCCPAGNPLCQAGHDLWMTRNGHLPGFDDGDWEEPAASILTKAAKELGACEVLIGSDGKLHFWWTRQPHVLAFWDWSSDRLSAATASDANSKSGGKKRRSRTSKRRLA